MAQPYISVVQQGCMLCVWVCLHVAKVLLGIVYSVFVPVLHTRGEVLFVLWRGGTLLWLIETPVILVQAS